MTVEPVTPSEGWGVLHLFCKTTPLADLNQGSGVDVAGGVLRRQHVADLPVHRTPGELGADL